MSSKIKHVTDGTYQQDVLDSELPVLVDFSAPWCGPCRMLEPILDQLSEEYDGDLVFAKVNTDESPNTPSQLGIRGIPTLIIYVDGEEVDRMTGMAPKAVLKKKLDAVLAEVKPA